MTRGIAGYVTLVSVVCPVVQVKMGPDLDQDPSKSSIINISFTSSSVSDVRNGQYQPHKASAPLTAPERHPSVLRGVSLGRPNRSRTGPNPPIPSLHCATLCF